MRTVPPSRRPDRSDSSAARRRAAFETLESRVLLSTYYVSTQGDDTNAGSLDHPFRTIRRAADFASPGDTVLIRGGTYRETVRPARSGTSSEPIVFKPYGT